MILSLSEQMAYSTARIECQYSDGTSGTGTGFFFKFLVDKENDTFVPVIITNKHVIKGSIKGRILITKASEDSKPVDREHYVIELDNFDLFWIRHPLSDVDLCFMQIGDYINRAKSQNESLFIRYLDMSLLPNPEQLKELSALEEIIMIGYPNGLWDSVNNKPIFRKGITATNFNFDYNGKKEFVIDAACFPGSSGSPVMIINEGMYKAKHGPLIAGVSRVLLLGILYAGPQYTATGEIKIIDIPTVSVPVALSNIPNNLGYVIKSERIKELERLVGG